MSANTLFLRLEGPFQAWGDQESKFVIRRTAEAPTKSGVVGMLCAALGMCGERPPQVGFRSSSNLRMGVRMDAPGVRWWDYHTVGAGMHMRIAEGEGKTKPGAMLTRREYLCDASFLVALHGGPEVIDELGAAMESPDGRSTLGENHVPRAVRFWSIRPAIFPIWTCVRRIDTLASAAKRRSRPQSLDCLLDWVPPPEHAGAPADALVWYDVPLTFEPPSHRTRFVVRRQLRVGADGEVSVAEKPAQNNTPRPPRPRADYRNTEYRSRREQRLDADCGCACSASLPPRPHSTSPIAEPAETNSRTTCARCAGSATTP